MKPPVGGAAMPNPRPPVVEPVAATGERTTVQVDVARAGGALGIVAVGAADGTAGGVGRALTGKDQMPTMPSGPLSHRMTRSSRARTWAAAAPAATEEGARGGERPKGRPA